MDQAETSRLKQPWRGEYSQARPLTGATTSLRTNESSQPSKSTRSDHGWKFDVFLSHSGKQKIFVRQLHRDLTNRGVSCFFDEDPECLPVGEHFPSRILDAAKTCKIAVLLLSHDFLKRKGPMLELSAFVEARDTTRTNPDIKILPVFFLISPAALKNITELNKKWKQFEKSREERDKWMRALSVIQKINGLLFEEGGDEVEFREKIVQATEIIVKRIWKILPTSPRYPGPCMQGEVRMCQEVADFFNKVQPNEKGFRIAGLYGIAGHGKTTLGKAFCNVNLGKFEGRVCYLEFSRGDSFEKVKLALQHLTYCPQSHLQTLTREDQARVELYERVNGQRVLLILDNITEESIDEVRYYVQANFGKHSCVLLSARSEDVLVEHFKIDSQSCMPVPNLEEDEAISILLESTNLEVSMLGAKDKAFALNCAIRCSFDSDIIRRGRAFHPLALKVFGGHLFSKYGSNLSKWVAEVDALKTTNLPTSESSQANNPTHSDHGQRYLAQDVFLSHSGAQKDFVRMLNEDLTAQNVSCFFDEDCEILPKGEEYPPRIFEAADTCRVAVLVISDEFLRSRWPMLELHAFVKAKNITKRNPNLKILPVFFKIQPKALNQFTADNESWKELEKSEEERTGWRQALSAIRKINGEIFDGPVDEKKFRDRIVEDIHKLLPASQRYHVPAVQGGARMCQEVANFFDTVQLKGKEIRIAGLYGTSGEGKTTLGKAFCNLKLGDFDRRVCHLEFSRGDPFERMKLALYYLTQYTQPQLQSLTSINEAQVQFKKRVRGLRVLLVLDHITEDSIDEVRDYLKAELGKNSCILLAARSVGVLKKFSIDSQFCMRVPRLTEEEAVAILLEEASLKESELGEDNRGFALECVRSFTPKFHPFALKVHGRHLFSKYGSNLSDWVADGPGDGLDDLWAVLDKAFGDMCPSYRTIFMLLSVYMPLNMPPHKVIEWLAINCNEEIPSIKKAATDLCNKAFIEEFEPLRIHDQYIEFAQSKAKRMERWLWWKGDGPSTRALISKDNAGFELAKLEQCMHRSPSQVAPKYLQNLLVLQLVGVQNMSELHLGQMESLRSITLHNCQNLAAVDGMENLLYLGWLQIRGVSPMFKVPQLSSVIGLQHLEIDIAGSQVLDQLGDLTLCLFLREIIVRCPSLSEFPKLNGLLHLETVEFSMCGKVKGSLDCTECMELQRIVFDGCCEMAASPLLAGCKKLSKIVLLKCDAVTTCPDIDVPSALKTLELQISSEAASAPKSLEFCYGLENLQLQNMGELKALPSFTCLSNLTVLKLDKCGIRKPPDLTSCVKLEDVCFSTLKNLERLPSFSSLRKLKKLSLSNCRRVQDPPDISRCHELQVFHLVYNDNMERLPKMDVCVVLEEIELSWHSEGEVNYGAIDPDSWEVDDYKESSLGHIKYEELNSSVASVPEALKKLQWLMGKTVLAKQYLRGGKLYYSVTASRA